MSNIYKVTVSEYNSSGWQQHKEFKFKLLRYAVVGYAMVWFGWKLPKMHSQSFRVIRLVREK